MARHRDYKKEDKYEATPLQKKNRAARNKARREEMRAGKVRKGDGKDVDHIHPLIKGGSTSKSNLRVVSVHTNRSFKRTKNAGMR